MFFLKVQKKKAMEDMFEILQAIQASVGDFPVTTSFSVNTFHV